MKTSFYFKHSFVVKIYFTLCFTPFYFFSQSIYVGAIEQKGYGIMYRGYDNLFNIVVSNCDTSEIKVFSNAEIRKVNNYYVCRATSPERVVNITVIINKTEKNDTVGTWIFNVRALPDPIVYWGGIENGKKANIKNTSLSAKYGPETPISASFVIRKWTIKYKNKSISGAGFDLKSAEEFLKKVRDESILEFQVSVLGPDKITREINCFFRVNSWKTEQENTNAEIMKCEG